ncbi:putative reverse transcriptase domain-containing protein [Tanacetum coccineum]
MSDSDESGVTYTEVSSPFEGLSDIGSPRADDHEYLELPWMPEDPYVEAALQAPPSPDYVPGPEEPEQAPPSPDYVPGPEHADDEIVAEDQPYAEDASPTAQSPDYVPESDPEADPEEDDDEDPEEDPVDYPADGGDDGDDEDEPSEEDEDDDVDIEADEDEEEEEHPAPADSVVVALPATDQAPSAEETEPFETDESAATPPPHPAYRVTARISIPAPVPTPVWSDAEVARLLAISTPPSSPLSPWSSPLPQIPSPPLPSIPSPSLPVSPPLPVSSPVPVLSPSPPASPIRSFTDIECYVRLRAEAASTSYSLPLPPPFILSYTRPAAPSSGTPPLHLLSTDRREDRPEVTLPPRKRLGIALGPAYEVRESSSAAAARPAGGLRADYGFVATMDREIRHDLEREVGYGITDSWDEIVKTLTQEAQLVTVRELGRHMTMRLGLGKTRDRRAHAYTRHLMEIKARLSREAWRRSMDAIDLWGPRRAVLYEMLGWQTIRGHVTILHGQVTASTGLVTALKNSKDPLGAILQERAWQQGIDRLLECATTCGIPMLMTISHDVSYAMAWADSSEKEKTTSTIQGTEMKKLEAVNCLIKIERYVGGHFKRECPKPKNNKNRGNQVGNDRAPAKVYAVGHVGTNPDSNVVTGTFLLNNRYASILFFTGADTSFVSTAFSSQIDITPSTLDHYYDVESRLTARLIGLNTSRGCTLNILNHPFNINLMPVELGSFDAIIGMDWLAKYQAIIVCAEKIVRIP